MPPKIKQLIKELERAGFVNRGGKGSHRNFVHPKVTKPVTISGKVGDEPCATKKAMLIKRLRSQKNEKFRPLFKNRGMV